MWDTLSAINALIRLIVEFVSEKICYQTTRWLVFVFTFNQARVAPLPPAPARVAGEAQGGWQPEATRSYADFMAAEGRAENQEWSISYPLALLLGFLFWVGVVVALFFYGVLDAFAT